jgi:hypothetical protein
MGRRSRRKQAQRQKGRMGPNHHPSRRRRRKWILGTLFFLVAIGAIVAWQWKSPLWAYKVAPSFTLQASTGQLISLRDYIGKQEVVLIFYMGAG